MAKSGVSKLLTRFGDNLRSVRKAQGVSQENLANTAGMHRTYVSSVERRERNDTLETVEKLANALKVSMTELIPE